MPVKSDKIPDSENQTPKEYSDVLDTIPEVEPEPKKESTGEFLFQVFCAVIFLGMIGLVFYNTMLRYVFSDSYPPSEEWARFLFMYITFFGSIEAFYRKKQIAVDMFVDLFHGSNRKALDITASILGMLAMAVLLFGSSIYLGMTYDQKSVATNVYFLFIYGPLPIMAAAVLLIQIRDFMELVGTTLEVFCKAVLAAMAALACFFGILYAFAFNFETSGEVIRFLLIYLVFFAIFIVFVRTGEPGADGQKDRLLDASARQSLLCREVIGICLLFVVLVASIFYIAGLYDDTSDAIDVDFLWIYGPLPIMAIAGLALLIKRVKQLRQPVAEQDKG